MESEIWDSDAAGFLMNVKGHPSWNLVGKKSLKFGLKDKQR
jgi:hypothetical protein